MIETRENGNGAVLSDDNVYRYLLWRVWNCDKKVLAFIMLNPSTANATKNDATIRRCISFAALHGFGGIMVANLFAYRATKPKDMPLSKNAIGPMNDQILNSLAEHNYDVCFAWGTKGNIQDRNKAVIKLFPNAMCLEKTKDGHPKHPLFISKKATLKPFNV